MTSDLPPEDHPPGFISRRDPSRVSDLAAELANAPEVPPYDDRNHAPGKAAGPGGTEGEGSRASPPPDRDRGVDRVEGRPRGEIFDHSPVKALGVYGDISFYLDRLGQLRAVDNHSLDKIRHVFSGRIDLLSNHFPQFDKDGIRKRGKFDQADAALAMVQASTERGVWSPTGRVRGPGCWTDDDGALIMHAGDAVYIDGKWQPPGVYDDKVYAAGDAVPRPADKPQRDDPAEELLDMLESWNWRRPGVDPFIALGLVCAQMMGGALEWRPVAWLTGDAATGKSTFQRLLLYVHGGETGLLQAADATEAGIRSVLGYSSLPVAIDELEPDVDRPQKVKAVVELARRASSGAQIFRGSVDQKGHQSNAYSCFMFSSILVPPMPPQDRSRLILLDLDRLPDDAPRMSPDPRTLRRIGQGLRRRLVEAWEDFPARLEAWREALAGEGHSGRGADNYGTVLALADIVTSDTLQPAALASWAKKLGKAITDEAVEIGSNAEDMITHLMASTFDPYRRGETYTIAQWVMAAAQMKSAPAALQPTDDLPGAVQDKTKELNARLAKIGLRVRGTGDTAELFLPNKNLPGLSELFQRTPWADGVWSQAARRLPGATSPPSPLRLAGISTRGVYIPVSSIAGLTAFQTDKRAPDGAPLPPDPLADFQ